MKLKGISGTSVGALNGALICMNDIEAAERLWKNISYSQIMSVDDEVVGKLFQHQKIDKQELRGMLDHLAGGGLDVTPLKQLIADCVDEEKIKNYSHRFVCAYF